MRQSLIILLSSTVITVQSCILENRSHCPAYLTLDFTETPSEVHDIYLIIRHENGFIFMDTVHSQDFDKTYEVSIRRGMADIAAFANIVDMAYDNGYYIKTGEEADMIYTCFSRISCNGELAFEKIRPLKNYIGMHLNILGTGQEALSVTVTSTAIGYSLEGRIVEGAYRFQPEGVFHPDASRPYFSFTSRILRQKDTSLSLTVSSSGEDNPVSVIPLYSYLEEAGIDMNSKELKDLYLTLDLSSSKLIISPVGWDDVNHFEITI